MPVIPTTIPNTPINKLSCSMMVPGKDTPCLHYIPLEEGVAGLCDCSDKFVCDEALKSKLPKLSHSAVNVWMRCKMEYYYSQILGISAKENALPIPMKMGKVWDKFMENDPNTDYTSMCERLGLDDRDKAKLSALMAAFEDIGIERVKGIPQLQVKSIISNHTVIGYIDNGLTDGFEEFKLSTNPKYYQIMGKIYHQCGTYFMADPSFEYVDMKITQVPLLRTGSGQYAEETPEQFRDRIYYDILSRPAYYFIGYDLNTKKWGKRFYRNEFPLEYLEKQYRWVFQEIRDTIDRGSWYRNDHSCEDPYLCMYSDICKTGVMSNVIYEYRNKGDVLLRV